MNFLTMESTPTDSHPNLSAPPPPPASALAMINLANNAIVQFKKSFPLPQTHNLSPTLPVSVINKPQAQLVSFPHGQSVHLVASNQNSPTLIFNSANPIRKGTLDINSGAGQVFGTFMSLLKVPKPVEFLRRLPKKSETERAKPAQYKSVEIDVENGKLHISYSEDTLKGSIYTRVCPVRECDKLIKRTMNYQKHVGTHYEGKKFKEVYHCPVDGCYANYKHVGMEKTTFANTKYVKQHFVKRHHLKIYTCDTCGNNNYATLPLLHYHKRLCRKSEKCLTCNKKFKIDQLQKHAIETGHKYEKEKVDEMVRSAYAHNETNPLDGAVGQGQAPVQVLLLSPVSTIFPPNVMAFNPFTHPPQNMYIEVGTQTDHHNTRASSPSKRSSSRTSDSQTDKLVSVTTGTLTVDLETQAHNQHDQFPTNSSPKRPKRPKLKKHHEAQTYNITKRRRSSIKKLEVQSTHTQTQTKLPSTETETEVPWPANMIELFQEEWDTAETQLLNDITSGISEVETQTEELFSTNDPIFSLCPDDIDNYLETMDSETQTFRF